MRTKAALSLLVILAGMLLATAPGRADGVSVALTPAMIRVHPGEVFDLDIAVTQAGAPFNGFEAIVGWDPAALTCVAHAQGTLMTDACGNTFHRFRPGMSADTIAVGLLCNGISVTGPGQIYHLQFQASLTPQATTVLLQPGLQFYDAGLYVPVDYAGDAGVGIGVGSVGVEPSPPPRQLRLRIAPNPVRDGAVFTIEAGGAGPQRLRVTDVRGRVVRRLEPPAAVTGARSMAWDARDDEGKALPSGIYLVTLEAAGQTVSRRVVILR